MGSWRRVSDWSHEIEVAHLWDLTEQLGAGSTALKTLGLDNPVHALRPEFPNIAGLLERDGLVQVNESTARTLHDLGIITWRIGFHRETDVLEFGEFGVPDSGTSVFEVNRITLEGEDFEARSGTDGVDAILRLESEGHITEAAIILAELVPPLSFEPWTDAQRARLAAHEDLDPQDLPDVEEAFLDAVFEVLREEEPGPSTISMEQRRAYQKQAGLAITVCALLTAVTLPFTPWVAALLPVPVLISLMAIGIHEVLIRQERL